MEGNDKKRKREETKEHSHHHHHDGEEGHHHHHHDGDHHHHHHHHHEEHEHKVKRHEPSKEGDDNKELTWEAIAKKTTVGDLCSRKAVQKPLVTLRDTATLRQAMDTLSSNSILSAPVLDSHHKFIGFVDVLDIVGYILTTYGKKSDKFDDPHFVKDEFFQSDVKKLLNFSKVDKAVEVAEDASIAELIELFADPARYHRLHRVAVVDKHKKLINVVSQSDIIALAVANLSSLPAEKRSKTLADLKIVHKPIFARIDDPFMDALETLYENRVSGIALIDAEARISANFSASDLRGMNDTAFRHFNGTTLSFLVKATDAKLGAPVQCLDTTSFEDALKTVYENRIHRLYIVTDLGEHISGVVSISDLVPLLDTSN